MLKPSKVFLFGLLALLLAAGCVDDPESQKEVEKIEGIGPLEIGKKLLVTTKDISSGSLSVIDLEAMVVEKNLLDLNSDLRVTKVDNTPYIVERFGGDNIKRLTSGLAVDKELSLGSGSNPYDIEKIDDNWLMVSLYGTDYLAIVNTGTLTEDVGKRISLSAYSDHGVAETYGMAKHGSYIYVAMQNLGDAGSAWAVVNDAKLLKINVSDVNSLSVETVYTIPFRNPNTDLQLWDDGGTMKLVFSSVGSYFSSEAVGVTSFDITAGTFVSNYLLENNASVDGTAIDHIHFINGTTAFAQAYKGYDAVAKEVKHSLFAFDPSAAPASKVTKTLSSVGYMSCMMVYNGKVYVCDRSTTNPGIRVFDATTFQEITKEPIDVGLPPNSVVMIDK